MKERLDKFIASQSTLSRKDAAKAIREKRVTVNGELCREGDRKIDTDLDTVKLDGSPLSYRRNVYYMLNKPAGVISATEDREERTVIDLVPPEMRREGLFPAGRLDKDTTGLLILTDDGGFAHRMLSPKKHVDKTYIADLDREPEDTVPEAFEKGIVLGDGTLCQPGQAVPIGGVRVKVVIREGKYHQVKRMFAALGYHVQALERVKIGSLALDQSLAEGELRELSAEEAAKVFEK